MAFKFGSNTVIALEDKTIASYIDTAPEFVTSDSTKRIRATLTGVNVYGNLKYGSIGVGSGIGGVGEVAGWSYGGLVYNTPTTPPTTVLSTIRKFPFASTSPSTAPQALNDTGAAGYYNTGWGTDSYAFYLRGVNASPVTSSPGQMYYVPYSSAGTASLTSIGTFSPGQYGISGGGNGLQNMELGYAVTGYRYPSTFTGAVNVFPFAKHEFRYATVTTLTTSDIGAPMATFNTASEGFTAGGLIDATSAASTSIYKYPYAAIGSRVSYGTTGTARYGQIGLFNSVNGYAIGGRTPSPTGFPATNNIEKFPFSGTVPVATTIVGSTGARFNAASHNSPTVGFIAYGDNGPAAAGSIISFPFASEVFATHYPAPGTPARYVAAGATSQ